MLVVLLESQRVVAFFSAPLLDIPRVSLCAGLHRVEHLFCTFCTVLLGRMANSHTADMFPSFFSTTTTACLLHPSYQQLTLL